MSLALQPVENRQSCQAVYTVPAPSISADGSGEVRRLPAFGCTLTCETFSDLSQLAPPFSEVKAAMVFCRLSKGTTTVPFGCTTGWPPRPWTVSAVASGVLQVRPP